MASVLLPLKTVKKLLSALHTHHLNVLTVNVEYLIVNAQLLLLARQICLSFVPMVHAKQLDIDVTILRLNAQKDKEYAQMVHVLLLLTYVQPKPLAPTGMLGVGQENVLSLYKIVH